MVHDGSRTIIAVDPGSAKCGVAVARFAGNRDSAGAVGILHKAIIPESALEATLTELSARYNPSVIVVGAGTRSRACAERLRKLSLAPVETIDETGSTLDARGLYLQDHPRPWYLRWIPSTLICPRCPLDDYAAVVLARRYWEVARRRA